MSHSASELSTFSVLVSNGKKFAPYFHLSGGKMSIAVKARAEQFYGIDPRTEMLYNIDPYYGDNKFGSQKRSKNAAIRVGAMKLILGGEVGIRYAHRHLIEIDCSLTRPACPVYSRSSVAHHRGPVAPPARAKHELYCSDHNIKSKSNCEADSHC